MLVPDWFSGDWYDTAELAEVDAAAAAAAEIVAPLLGGVITAGCE